MRLTRAFAPFAVVFSIFILSLPPVRGEEPVVQPQEWQAVITGQIEAFKRGDGAAALEFAGAWFQGQFAEPDEFVEWIRKGGYSPILDSRSHDFGPYKLDGNGLVLQIVNLAGPNQDLYEATYQLGREPEGWRVQGVALRKMQGIGV